MSDCHGDVEREENLGVNLVMFPPERGGQWDPVGKIRVSPCLIMDIRYPHEIIHTLLL